MTPERLDAALAGLEGLVVIDEVQRVPELFPLLRVLVDRRPRHQRYLILGSESRELIRQSSESLLLGPRQVGKSTLLASLRPDLTLNLAIVVFLGPRRQQLDGAEAIPLDEFLAMLPG